MGILVKNYSGSDKSDMSEMTSSNRIGRRIRRIRTARGLSQTELGERVGLTPDRIQKYENGVRKPKFDLMKKIAAALDVDALAFMDPDVSNYIGVMFALFEMEELFDIKVEEQGPNVLIKFDNEAPRQLINNLYSWIEVIKERDDALEKAKTDEDRASIIQKYNDWEWNFPKALVEDSKKELINMYKDKAKEYEDMAKKLENEIKNNND